RVPGASLAYWHGGEIHQEAAGLLNRSRGVEVTPESLFQIGSVTKIWTTAQIMLLAERGELSLDTPVADVLPEIGHGIRIEHLLCHTSGLDGDFFHDTGRGDDCLSAYVTALAARPLTHPVGVTHSYSNGAFSVAGRVIEVVTGQVWDAALREQLIEPLGLTHTWTLPEDVLRFRSATGHLGEAGEPTPTWAMPRSNSPAGQICSTAADLVRFGRSFLEARVLDRASVEAMARPRVEPPCHVYGSHWGLGWIVDAWDGAPVWLHGGNTIGQAAMLWVVPDLGTVVALLCNGGDSDGLIQAVARGLFPKLCGLRPPAPPAPGPPAGGGLDSYEGVYERTGVRLTVGNGRLTYENIGELADLQPPLHFDLVPGDGGGFLARRPGDRVWARGA